MSTKKAHILLVEDDKNLGFIMQDFLELSGFTIDWAETGDKGWEFFKKKNYALCLLDVMLPNKDGFSLATDIRKKDEQVPIIFLTAKNMQEDIITGLKAGADDYITKPFSTEELLLRIKAILKRSQKVDKPSNNDKIALGKYIFDPMNQSLIIDGKENQLTKKESALLKMLCDYQNNILRREIALKEIWGEDDYFMGRSMDVYITKLRKQLKEDENINIINVHRTGFKLEVKG